jgi:pimeloyl-ACP methyl ester carboxylesterase
MELAHTLWKPDLPDYPKLVLLHGMGGTGSLWRPIAASLEDRYGILAVDQRGHGKSQVSFLLPSSGDRLEPGYTPLDYGRDVVDTLDQLQFHPTWILGHSMGVRSACAAAHLKSDWVRGLILVDLGFSGPAGGGLGEGLASFLKVLPMEFTDRNEARAFMQAHCPDPSIVQYLLAVSMRTNEGRLTFPFDKAALIKTIQAARDSSVRTWVRALGERGMPILVLRGGNSLVWSRGDFETERELFADLPSIVFEEFPGAGHGLPFEKRLEFVGRIDQFMRNSSN